MIATNTTAQVFVTTYAIGNSHGFACGKYFELDEYDNKEDFVAAAMSYARNTLGDCDPELCFPDYELAFNESGLISKSGISEKIWDLMELTCDDLQLIEAYTKALGGSYVVDDLFERLEDAGDALVGQWDSLEDFAHDKLGESLELSNLPNSLNQCNQLA